MYASANATLDDGTIELTGFLAGGKPFAFIRGRFGRKGNPIFWHSKGLSFSNTWFVKGLH